MCGIAGFLNRRSQDNKDLLASMIAQVSHRGPDGYGFYNDQNVGLAHARLSIIDLAGGFQPIHNEDKTVWVVFNGEIFNYVELRKGLEKRGHKFYTNTDTEVIVHLYEDKGIDMVHDLVGQFAIVLWDKTRGVSYLLRDRFGVRPLFYTMKKGTLYFASEVKSLFANPSISRTINTDSLSQIFTFWGVSAPQTIFNGILSVPEGSYVEFAASRTPKVVKYWDHDYTNRNETISLEEAKYEFLELFNNSVKIRLRSDVPVGAYLSGGLDSSAIVATMAKYHDNIRTFSIEFDDDEFNEKLYQQDLIASLDINHTSFVCSYDDIVKSFPTCVFHTESPMLRTAPVPMMILSKLVKKSGYTVVLTGEGADEALGGYDLFRENIIRRMLVTDPNSKDINYMIDSLYSWDKKGITKSIAMFRGIFSGDHGDLSKSYFSHLPRWKTSSFTNNFLTDELQSRYDYNKVVALYDNALSGSHLNHAQYLEYHTLLSNYLLSSQGDRVAMASSIEGRYPFLDHRVVELCNKLPDDLKIRNGVNEKLLLKEAMKGLVPSSILERKKQPYRSPDGKSFFKSSCNSYVFDVLSDNAIKNAGYFNKDKVSRLVDKFQKGLVNSFRDDMAFVGILSTQLLHSLFVENFETFLKDVDQDKILIDINGDLA